jgi:hypothetical protein
MSLSGGKADIGRACESVVRDPSIPLAVRLRCSAAQHGHRAAIPTSKCSVTRRPKSISRPGDDVASSIRSWSNPGLTLEVEAEAPNGFSGVGVVRDNARQLKFKAKSSSVNNG